MSFSCTNLYKILLCFLVAETAEPKLKSNLKLGQSESCVYIAQYYDINSFQNFIFFQVLNVIKFDILF